MNKLKPRIFDKERKKFKRLWHSYHAKHKIPYSHDEAEDFFLQLTLIFCEDGTSLDKV